MKCLVMMTSELSSTALAQELPHQEEVLELDRIHSEASTEARDSSREASDSQAEVGK